MNFQQLRIIREAIRCNFNLTAVSEALYTSQSGVSKHIRDLEEELGVELFIRKGKRLLGLTEPGREMAAIAERILIDAANAKRLAQQFAQTNDGELIVATTHTQARYALPPVVAAFKQEFPNVHLVLHQGSPTEIAHMVLDEEANIAVATESLVDNPELVTFPYYAWHHGLIVPRQHALANLPELTLEAIAAWPIITYHRGFTGRGHLDERFAEAGIKPDIVMAALDADVIKNYVELGLGVGLIASMAFVQDRDTGLQLLDCSHLFDERTSVIAVRRGRYLRDYAYRFIELCAPHLVMGEIRGEAASASSPSSLRPARRY